MSYKRLLGITVTFTAILLAAGVTMGNGASNLTLTKQSADAQMMDGNNTGMMMPGDKAMMKMGYNIMVISPNMNFSKVVVDPGNGEVLLTEQISKEQHMMMHGMAGEHMMGPGMIMGGGPDKMMRHDMMTGSPGGTMMGGYPG